MKAGKFDSSLQTTFRWAAAGVGLFLVAHAITKELTKFNLSRKVVLITGGSRGMGLVLARHLTQRGARLAIAARSADDLELARQDLEARGAQVITMTADVTNNEEVKALIRDVIYHYGRLDVLINNAGIVQVGPQEVMGLEEYQVAMQTNFWPQLYAMHAAIPHFLDRGHGRIVNITSIAIPRRLPYTARKFAVVGLSEGMHAELKKHDIHVTTVVPNLMRTGSPLHAAINGDHEKEHAWFKHAGSNPLLSSDPDRAAEMIIRALEYGQPEVTLSLSGKVARIVQELAPRWVNFAMGIANRLLPDAATGGTATVKGWQAESARSNGPISDLSDKAAAKNNE